MSKILKISSIIVAICLIVLITFLITRYKIKLTPDDSSKEKSKLIDPSPEGSPLRSTRRLPDTIVPINYDLKIQPYLLPDQLNFNGSVLILVNCNQSTGIIQLNANKLEINQKTIRVEKIDAFNDVIDEIKVKKFDYENEMITLELDQNLKEDENYTIYFDFKGDLKTPSLIGFYKSSYIDQKTGETRFSVLAHFEPTFARWAFPCWDEPAFKATFDIELIHWYNQTAISNMPNISHEVVDSDWSRTKFDRTVKMSTYLVTWAVGDFAFKTNSSGVPVFRVVTRPSEIDTAEIANNLGPRILSHYEDYFKIKFPLPKIDLLATPDFSSGATEDWGLILFRESLLLFNNQKGSVGQLYLVHSVIAHELSHQWFGNLVTMKWWDQLWLNEGFATYMSYKGSDFVKPEWKVFARFVIDELQDVMKLDSLRNTHPISVEVHDPSEITQIFDRISYAKAASIIRMLNHIIGEDVFKDGLHNYLIALQYSNADQLDLWNHLQESYDKNNGLNLNIKEIMDSWTLKEGFPLVTITRDWKTNQVRFSQKRFLLNSDEKDEDKLIRTQYEVPITYTTKTEQNWQSETRVWLHKNSNGSESFSIEKIYLSNDDWLIANLNEIGFYRVNYDQQNWNLLIEQLHKDPTKIGLLNRLQILDDLFALAENGIVNYDRALYAFEYLINENDSLPWTLVGQLTNKIDKMLNRSPSYGLWQSYIRNLTKFAYEKFKMNELNIENLQDNQMQKLVVTAACANNLDECVVQSKELFNQYVNDLKENSNASNRIPTNVRQTVYCTAIYHGDQLEWDFIYKLYLKEQNAAERNVLLSSLTCSRVPWILTRYLNWTFDDDSGIRIQDAEFVFKQLAANNYSKDIAFNFLRNNWIQIEAHISSKQFDNIFKWFDHLNTEFELNLMKQFYRKVKHLVGSSRPYHQTIESIASNIKWLSRSEDEIKNYLVTKSL